MPYGGISFKLNREVETEVSEPVWDIYWEDQLIGHYEPRANRVVLFDEVEPMEGIVATAMRKRWDVRPRITWG